jgi:hypothetical protein
MGMMDAGVLRAWDAQRKLEECRELLTAARNREGELEDVLQSISENGPVCSLACEGCMKGYRRVLRTARAAVSDGRGASYTHGAMPSPGSKLPAGEQEYEGHQHGPFSEHPQPYDVQRRVGFCGVCSAGEGYKNHECGLYPAAERCCVSTGYSGDDAPHLETGCCGHPFEDGAPYEDQFEGKC